MISSFSSFAAKEGSWLTERRCPTVGKWKSAIDDRQLAVGRLTGGSPLEKKVIVPYFTKVKAEVICDRWPIGCQSANRRLTSGDANNYCFTTGSKRWAVFLTFCSWMNLPCLNKECITLAVTVNSQRAVCVADSVLSHLSFFIIVTEFRPQHR